MSLFSLPSGSQTHVLTGEVVINGQSVGAFSYTATATDQVAIDADGIPRAIQMKPRLLPLYQSGWKVSLKG